MYANQVTAESDQDTLVPEDALRSLYPDDPTTIPTMTTNARLCRGRSRSATTAMRAGWASRASS